MFRCVGVLWLQEHTARISTLLRWQNISLCALLISRHSYYWRLHTQPQFALKLGRVQFQNARFQRLESYWPSNNNVYLLQLGCHPVAVVILHVNKT